MANAKVRKLTKKEVAALHKGLAKANLEGLRVRSLHLSPRPRSVGAAAAPDETTCHAVQLPNGHWVIVCE